MKTRLRLLAYGAGLAAMTAPSAALAQQPAANASSAESAASREIVVVGSQIKGAKTTGALPVTVLDAADIAATGAVSGDELFRAIPQAGDVNFQASRTTGNLNDARGDIASINLRSLGTGNTLVLLNGRRVNVAPGTQTENFVPVLTVNTNSIPVAGIRRTEVLRDGAAAIYGADAVAGVVNIVLDDRYEGLQLSAQQGYAEAVDETVLGLKAGRKLSDRTHVSLFAGFTKRDALRAGDRSFSRSEDHTADLIGTPSEGDTSFDTRSTSAPWGGFRTIPTTVTVRQGTATLTTTGAFYIQPSTNPPAPCSSAAFNNVCIRSGVVTGAAQRPLRYDGGPQRTLLGEIERFNAFSTLTHDFGAVELFAEAAYYHANFKGSREQSAPLSTAPISIPANAFWNPFGPATSPNRLPNLTGVPTGGLPLTIANYRPVDAGPRTYEVTDDSYRALVGLRGEAYGFDWETAASYSEATTEDVSKNQISNTLFQAALSRTTAAAYNPFNGGDPANPSGEDATPNPRSVIDTFVVDVAREGATSLATWDFRVSRADLFKLPAGGVGLAAGVEARRETYADDRDPRLDGKIKYTDAVTGITYNTDVLGASGAPDVKADRTITSAYVEIAVPIVSPEMGIPFVKALDLQIAGRAENYSDFGDVAKPKVAGLWEIFEGLSVRGSYSQSFRAPNLPQFYSDGATVSNTRTDWAFCRLNGTTCSGASTVELRSGNRDLQPEEADTTSYGFVFQPTFLPPSAGRLTATVDVWSIAITNAIGIQDAPTEILYDLLLRQRGSFNPNVVRDPPVAGQTVGALSLVQQQYRNLLPRDISGIDYTIDYTLRDTPIGEFRLRVNAAQLTEFEQQANEIQKTVIAANGAGAFGAGVPNPTGAGNQIKINGNPRWRGSASLIWSEGPWTVNGFYSYVGPVFDTGAAIVNGQRFQVDEQLTSSYYVQYNFGRAGIVDGLRARVGVRNLEDKAPPLASTNVGYFGQLSSPLGQYWYASLTKNF